MCCRSCCGRSSERSGLRRHTCCAAYMLGLHCARVQVPTCCQSQCCELQCQASCISSCLGESNCPQLLSRSMTAGPSPPSQQLAHQPLPAPLDPRRP